ncbi:MAG: hypothetical protein ED859_02750 [Desulfuromonadales bacterium]|nr:MAG: hypothetical protein ED859_02750 [Desulfuromonadales bacterium]
MFFMTTPGIMVAADWPHGMGAAGERSFGRCARVKVGECMVRQVSDYRKADGSCQSIIQRGKSTEYA